MTVVGYARVSTQGRDLSAQLAALKAASATTIYREKISGVRADRPQLKKMVSALRRGDLALIAKWRTNACWRRATASPATNGCQTDNTLKPQPHKLGLFIDSR